MVHSRGAGFANFELRNEALNKASFPCAFLVYDIPDVLVGAKTACLICVAAAQTPNMLCTGTGGYCVVSTYFSIMLRVIPFARSCSLQSENGSA